MCAKRQRRCAALLALREEAPGVGAPWWPRYLAPLRSGALLQARTPAVPVDEDE